MNRFYGVSVAVVTLMMIVGRVVVVAEESEFIQGAKVASELNDLFGENGFDMGKLSAYSKKLAPYLKAVGPLGAAFELFGGLGKQSEHEEIMGEFKKLHNKLNEIDSKISEMRKENAFYNAFDNYFDHVIIPFKHLRNASYAYNNSRSEYDASNFRNACITSPKIPQDLVVSIQTVIESKRTAGDFMQVIFDLVKYNRTAFHFYAGVVIIDLYEVGVLWQLCMGSILPKEARPNNVTMALKADSVANWNEHVLTPKFTSWDNRIINEWYDKQLDEDVRTILKALDGHNKYKEYDGDFNAGIANATLEFVTKKYYWLNFTVVVFSHHEPNWDDWLMKWYNREKNMSTTGIHVVQTEIITVFIIWGTETDAATKKMEALNSAVQEWEQRNKGKTGCFYVYAKKYLNAFLNDAKIKALYPHIILIITLPYGGYYETVVSGGFSRRHDNKYLKVKSHSNNTFYRNICQEWHSSDRQYDAFVLFGV